MRNLAKSFPINYGFFVLEIERVRMRDAEVAPLRVSLNSQQYAQIHSGFRYYPPPNVTLLSPATGPAHGGAPALLLAGTYQR